MAGRLERAGEASGICAFVFAAKAAIATLMIKYLGSMLFLDSFKVSRTDH